MLWRGGCRQVYIGRSINPEPSDQTSLNKQHRCNLEGGGGTDVEAEADMWDLGTSRPVGGNGQSHLASSQTLLRWSVFWCPLEPSVVVYAVDKRDLI